VYNSKNLLALTLCFSFIGSLVSADYIDCRRDDSSIAGGGAGAASGGRHSIVKSWMPEQIWINEDTGEFGTSKHPKDKISIRTSRGGYKLFARTNSRPSSVTYIVNLKRMEKSASVLMTASGFKNMGPLRYDCSFSSSTRSTQEIHHRTVLLLILNKCRNVIVSTFNNSSRDKEPTTVRLMAYGVMVQHVA